MKYENYLGIDTSSTSIDATLIDRTNTSHPFGKISSAQEGYGILIRELKSHGCEPSNTLVIVEATGRHHRRWVDALHQDGYRIAVINPILGKHAKPLGQLVRGNKSDPIDSAGLADFGRVRGDELSNFYYTPNHSREVLKNLSSCRRIMRKSLTSSIKSAGELLYSLWPEARKLGLNFASYQTLPELLLRVNSRKQLRALHDKTLKGFGINDADAFRLAIDESFIAEDVFDASLPALQHYCKLLQDLRERLEDLRQETVHYMKNIKKDDEYQLASSLTGFGDNTIPTLLAHLPAEWRSWGNKRKIANKLQAQWGITPRIRESGKWKGHVKMSKRGVESARTALWQIASVSLLHDTQMKAYYDKKRNEGKTHIHAICDVMRRQLRRFVAVLYDQKPYVPITQFSS